jgi:hypothetical protein
MNAFMSFLSAEAISRISSMVRFSLALKSIKLAS